MLRWKAPPHQHSSTTLAYAPQNLFPCKTKCNFNGQSNKHVNAEEKVMQVNKSCGKRY